MRAIGLFCCITFICLAACGNGSVEVSEDSFLDWARENAILFDSDDWPDTDSDELTNLDQMVDQAKIVFLGEPDHYVVEKYDYRLVMIRYLAEHGYRYIGMEMGMSDGMRIDRYLETGEAWHLDNVALYGYRGDLRTDRDDSPGPLVAWTDPSFNDAFVRAETGFLTELHSLSESLPERLHWFGFDIDPFPGGGYADLESLLAEYVAQTPVARLRAMLERVPGESREDEAERLEQLAQYLENQADTFEESLGGGTYDQLRHIVRNLIESLRFRDLAFREPLGQHWLEGLEYRETALVSRLDDGWLSDLPDDAKVILMGHNMHLSKEGETLRVGSIADGAPNISWPSFGSRVAERMAVCSVWMLYDHGTTLSAVDTDPIVSVASHPDRVEHSLSGIGPVFALPLRDDDDPRSTWLHQDLNFVQNGTYGSGALGLQADVIFFIDEVHAVGTEP